jgi:hypothetical protein
MMVTSPMTVVLTLPAGATRGVGRLNHPTPIEVRANPTLAALSPAGRRVASLARRGAARGRAARGWHGGCSVAADARQDRAGCRVGHRAAEGQAGENGEASGDRAGVPTGSVHGQGLHG